MSKPPPAFIAAAACLWAVTVGCAATENAPALRAQLDSPPAVEHATEERSDSPAPLDDAVEVEVDLSPHGMAATISAPRHAAVRASRSAVEVVAGADYHLLVGRGAVDPLGEKARIVRTFGGEFRRFLGDDGSLIVYETGTDQQQRYHFFMTARAQDEPYHCRTPQDGLARRAAVDHMIQVCRSVTMIDTVRADPG